MKILAIETSCDETAAAVLNIEDGKFAILANIVSSQIELHRKYGGVYPMLAKREHEKNLPMVIKEALKKAKLSEKKPKIDVLAVTIGPGLSPCLWTGLNKAVELADKWDVPLVPTDHMEGHLLVSLLDIDTKNLFPAIGLTVSGGHTQLVLIKDIGKYTLIGETRDDAAGECFDKTARILGLPYPGGPEIAKKAEKPSSVKVSLPRPMLNTKDYDFSFSGLKTAVLYQAKENKITSQYVRAMAKEIQQAIIDVLLKKTKRAARDYKAHSILIGGGVAANKELRAQFKKEFSNIRLLIPPVELCGDNAVMIGVAGYYRFKQGMIAKNMEELKAQPNLQFA
ncbi:MAG TPA: tRNA (adenosine(37)-N6)-threonylcarbamoyltransferase complex transferase subunit TsaD [Candidatus Wildermuthbacteria bacterium]|nr:tRNA (adenosine(37)-N6)-threonylcarbamoyltransferase complex transferase subunit TsaD [Candidatus Wildermuthbacteria bacterium]